MVVEAVVPAVLRSPISWGTQNTAEKIIITGQQEHQRNYMYVHIKLSRKKAQWRRQNMFILYNNTENWDSKEKVIITDCNKIGIGEI